MNNLVKKYLVILISVVWGLIIGSCTRSEKESMPVVATVNGEKIFLTEFEYFYELDPNFGINNKGIEELQREIQLLIDQKLAYKRAIQENLFDQLPLQTFVKWELKQAMQRELFRKVVKNRVSVSDEELRNFFREENRSLFVRHLFFKSRIQAENAYQLLKAGKKNFFNLAKEVFQDSILKNNGGALGWINPGDLHRNLEKVAYHLKIGEISPPIHSPWGYHIIRVDSFRENVMLTEAQYLAQKDKLKKKLLRRKQQELASRYIAKKMGQLKIRMKGDVFRRLWLSISGESTQKLKAKVLNRSVLTKYRIKQAKEDLKNILDAPLITFKGGNISLGALLDSLYKIPQSNRPRIASRNLFVNDIGIWVRNEFLYREAQNLHLQQNEKVRQELKEFKESAAFEYYLEHVTDTLQVPELVENYFRKKVKNKDEIEKKYPGIQRVKSVEEWKYMEATLRLGDWLRKPAPNVWINQSLLEELNKSIDWEKNIPIFLVRPPA